MSPDRSGVERKSSVEEDARCFILAPEALAVRILERPPLGWPACLISTMRDGPEIVGAVIGVPFTVALRDLSRACACASCNEMSLIGAEPALSAQPAMGGKLCSR